MSRAKIDAPGRLNHGPPLAVIDIGSNSVRLVVYEGLSRSPTALFNEKALCGLGREVQTTGLLAADAVEHALSALKRYRALCTTMGVSESWPSPPPPAATPRTAAPSSSSPSGSSEPTSTYSRARARRS